MFYLCYFLSFLCSTIRWWLNYTESDCFHWCENFISTGNEVAQLHTLVDWMRWGPRPVLCLLSPPPTLPRPPRKKSWLDLKSFFREVISWNCIRHFSWPLLCGWIEIEPIRNSPSPPFSLCSLAQFRISRRTVSYIISIIVTFRDWYINCL